MSGKSLLSRQITTVVTTLIFSIPALAAVETSAHTARARQAQLQTYDCQGAYEAAGGLAMDRSGNLFATAEFGGAYGGGGVFELSPDGQGGFTCQLIYSVGGSSDGAFPGGVPVLDGEGHIYGTSINGSNGLGAVWEIGPDNGGSWSLINSYQFSSSAEGGYPEAGVLLTSDGNIFSTNTQFGMGNNGGYGFGTIFEIATSSGTWTETTPWAFSGGADGAWPHSTLIADRAGNFYGTAPYGGNGTSYNYDGVVFKLSSRSGSWILTPIYKFQPGDAGVPEAGLVMDSHGNLYGTSSSGGTYGAGGVFKLSPYPTAVQASATAQWKISWLYMFTGGSDGGYPSGPLVFDNAGNLYGTAGVLFELSPTVTNGQTTWTESVVYDLPGAGCSAAGNIALDNAGHIYGACGSEGYGSKIVGFQVTP